MRVVMQRVRHAAVRVGGETVGRIGPGMTLLVAIGRSDTSADARALAEKVVHLRIFPDGEGKLNRSLLETGGEILCVSQLTLYGDCRRGRRPNYERAARPAEARARFQEFLGFLRGTGADVQTGRFQEMMEVELVNDGPVTLLLDSEKQI